MAGEKTQRRLAAILAADMAGYSRLMEADEEATVRTLKSHREAIDRLIGRHDGRIFSTAGDSVVAEFGSAVEAVRAAISIQEDLKARNAALPGGNQMMLRIGVNLGDIIVEGDNLYGDGVNVAARIEGLCAPGEILVSDMVQRQIEGKLAVGLEDKGEHTVKNIAKPVRVYQVLRETTRTAEPIATRDSLSLPDKPSIAVLAFENMSQDPEQEYFSDGISEDLITELTKISGLFVIARNSSFVYKGKSVSVKQVGQELGVRYVLEGSVRRSGNRLRITAQLIDTATDHHVWAERYDRDLEDIFAVQDDVTKEISTALEVTLGRKEHSRLGRPPTKNIEAYELSIQARNGFRPPTVDNILWARSTYQRVVSLDPGFAGGHAGLSMTYTRPMLLYIIEKTDKDVASARESADEAMRLDDALAASHMAQSLVALVTGEHDLAIKFASNAVERQPGDADAHANLGRVMYISGHPEDAFEPFKTAIRLDPQSPIFFVPLGFSYCMAGRFEDAIEYFKKAREAFRKAGVPGGLPWQPLVGWVVAAAELGNEEEVAAMTNELLKAAPDFTVSQCKFLERFAATGMKDRMAAALIRAGLPE